MPRKDIWKDGVKTRFSSTNQPAGRGRPRGMSMSRWFGYLLTAMMKLHIHQDNSRRRQRNARRRELYRQRNQSGNDFQLPDVSFPPLERMTDLEKYHP